MNDAQHLHLMFMDFIKQSIASYEEFAYPWVLQLRHNPPSLGERSQAFCGL